MTQVHVPLVALVGRPNVGKSTLFNRLTASRTALVYDQPGVTRDRIYGEATFYGKKIRVVDTGGLEMTSQDPMLSLMRQQTQLAIDEADLVLLVVDGIEGVHPLDREVAEALRMYRKPTVVVANKLDHRKHEHHVAEVYELGLEHVVGVSAEHGVGMDSLYQKFDAMLELPLVEDEESPGAIDVSQYPEQEGTPSQITWKGGPIHVAVIGRPNAGKSSLINTLLGEERLIASEVAGTTRDPIDTELTYEDQKFVLIDTAGVRRKRSIVHKLEQVAVVSAWKSIDRADVAVLVLDGAQRPTDQDARIASMAHEKGKGVVIVANKWDLIENPEWREQFPKAVRVTLSQTTYAPLVHVSAKTGWKVSSLLDAIVQAQRERHRRVGTGELNRFFKEVVESHPPPIQNGKRPKIYFVTQPLVRPPTFIFNASRMDDIHFSYRRYLENSLRKRYGFEGTPLWLKFRPHS
jgi:GTP-binding protein